MNLETYGSWQKIGMIEPSWNIPGNQLEWQDIVLDRVTSMFELDKNHTSILIWSCGNETYAGEVFYRCLNTLSLLIRDVLCITKGFSITATTMI